MDINPIDRFQSLLNIGFSGSCERIPGGFSLVARIKDPMLAPFVDEFKLLMVQVFCLQETMNNL